MKTALPSRMCVASFLLFLLPSLATASDSCQPWAADKVLVNGLDDAARFGAAVDVDKDLAIVGAPNQGPGAYILSLQNGIWVQSATIGSTANFSEFGAAVAIDSSRVMIGAPGYVDGCDYYDDYCYLGRVEIYVLLENGLWQAVDGSHRSVGRHTVEVCL